MRYGLSPRQVRSMYHSLAPEVLSTLGYEGAVPEFNFKDTYIHQNSIALTDFLPFTLEPISIDFGRAWIDFMYEDEVQDVLLHELAHVATGYVAGHNRMWQDNARSVGSCGSQWFYIRDFDKLPWRTEKKVHLPTLGYLSWVDRMA